LSGAPLLLFDKVALHPPLELTVANQELNAASMADCDWQDPSVAFVGQVNTTAGAAVTPNVALQLTGPSQVLVTVNITVFIPPQDPGAPLLLFDSVALQPPLVLTVANHALKEASMAPCV
jgi:hypothetical protein